MTIEFSVYAKSKHPYSQGYYPDLDPNGLGLADSVLTTSVPGDPPYSLWQYFCVRVYTDASFAVTVFVGVYTWADLTSGVVALDPTGVTPAALRNAYSVSVTLGYDNIDASYPVEVDMQSDPWGTANAVTEWQGLRDGDTLVSWRLGFVGLAVDDETGVVQFDAVYMALTVAYEAPAITATDPATLDAGGNTGVQATVAGLWDNLNALRGSLTLAGEDCTITDQVSSTVVEITTPAVAAGAQDLVLWLDDGQSATLSVTVAAANEAPTDITLSTSTVAENVSIGTDVGTFSTTDADVGDSHTYSLVSGAGSTGNASFTISDNTLQTAANLNFESAPTLSIRVRTTDSGALTFEKTFTITVTDVNEAPTGITLNTVRVPENSPSWTLAGNLSVTDPDADDTVSFALVAGTGSTDNDSFSIASASIYTADALVAGSYSVRVRVTDSGSLTFDQVFTIDVVVQPPDDRLTGISGMFIVPAAHLTMFSGGRP